MRIIKAKSVTYENRVSVQALDNISLSEGSIEDIHYVVDILDSNIESFTKPHRDKGIELRPLEDIVKYLKDNLLLILIDNSYLIGIDVIESYLSTEVILSEEFVFKLDGKSNFKSVVDTMEKLRENLGASKIQVGTLACVTTRQHESLARLYERQGFKRLQYTLEK